MRRRRFTALIGLAVLLAVPATAQARAFPKGFQWGVAAAGFQSEAGQSRNVDRGSDWYAWHSDPQNIQEGTVTGHRVEDGPGFFARWRHDVRLASKKLDLNAFRLGIEWSRIFPASTRGAGTLKELDAIANRRAIRRYRRILRRVRDSGMTPWVTLNHFSLPRWIHDPIQARNILRNTSPADTPPAFGQSGWLDHSTVDEFRKYASYVAWKLGDEVNRWVTLNEPMVVTVNGYANIPTVAQGNFPPGGWSFPGVITVIENQADANAAAYDAVKRVDRKSRVGVVHNMVAFTPADPDRELDRRGTEHADYLFNRLFLDQVVLGIRDHDVDGIEPGEQSAARANKADFIGLNYYFRGRVTGNNSSFTPQIPMFDFLPSVSYRSPANPNGPPCPTTCSEFGAEIYPEGFRQVLKTAGGYGRPVLVTENGISDSNEDQRPEYLRTHLRAMRDAMRAREADVRGYFHWSLVDNFEWSLGYTQKFGLFSYDPLTLRRWMRPSARLYARTARTGKLP
jgi:beta-glucosidase/6-phospho-beta-glucosidase/beta-galactosidase